MKTSKPDAPDQDFDADVDAGAVDPTDEVGSEGGGTGDLQTGVEPAPAGGSEAGETWRTGRNRRTAITRDETGRGRRNP
jgi:hypothetical protein